MADAVRRRMVVRGRVQGVFFRDSTERRARELGLAGWVANRDDGAVEIVAEGPADAVDDLAAFAREGPDRAEVRDVDVSDEEPEGLNGFEVR